MPVNTFQFPFRYYFIHSFYIFFAIIFIATNFAFSIDIQAQRRNIFEDSLKNRQLAVKLKMGFDNHGRLKPIIETGDKKSNLSLLSLDKQDTQEQLYPIYKYQLAQVSSGYVPDDINFDEQWGLKNQVSGINASDAWALTGKKLGNIDSCNENTRQCGGNPEVKVAIIDTGINTDVFDLREAKIDTLGSAKIYVNRNTTCNAGDRELDEIEDFTYCIKKGVADEDHFGGGHGTRVASVIAAQDNKLGGLGIAYNTTILPIALHQFSATDSGALDSIGLFYGIYHAVEKGAKIINLSLGTPKADTIVKKAVDYANQNGAIVVASAGNCAVWVKPDCDFNGNGRQDLLNEYNNAPFYPAAFNNTIAVGASNYATSKEGITRSCYSNIASYVDVVAPVGDFVDRSKPANVANCVGLSDASRLAEPNGVVVQDKNGQILLAEGTSFASPQVSAALALAVTFNPNLNFESASKLIESSSIDIGSPGKDDAFGYGLLNLPNLLNQAAEISSPVLTPPSKTTGFPDVDPNSTFAVFINNLKADGIVSGFSDGTFKPDQNVSRGEMAKFVRNSFFPGRLETFCGGFDDVPTSNPFFNEITTLKCLGVISGFGNNQFRPNQSVSRGESMKFAIGAGRVAKPFPEPYPTSQNLPNFKDVPENSTFYTFIMAGLANDIVSGFGDGTFKPNDSVSRGAMAKIVDNARFKEVLEDVQ